MRTTYYEISYDDGQKEFQKVEIGDIVVCLYQTNHYGIPFKVLDKCVETQVTLINGIETEREETRKYVVVTYAGVPEEAYNCFRKTTFDEGYFCTLKHWLEVQRQK